MFCQEGSKRYIKPEKRSNKKYDESNNYLSTLHFKYSTPADVLICIKPCLFLEEKKEKLPERGAPYLETFCKLSIEENLIVTSGVRPNADRTDSPGKNKYKRIRPLSPREFCLLSFQKALEMIDKSDSIYWANAWWILAADNLTFEEVMGDFKSILRTDFKGEKLARIYLGKNILH